VCGGSLYCTEGREAADRRRAQVHLQQEGGREQGSCAPAVRKQQRALCKEQVGERMEGPCLEKSSCSQELHAEMPAAERRGKEGLRRV